MRVAAVRVEMWAAPRRKLLLSAYRAVVRHTLWVCVNAERGHVDGSGCESTSLDYA